MPNTVKKKLNQKKLSSLLSKIPHTFGENFIKRAYASMAGVSVFQSFLEEKGVKISSCPPLHLNPVLLEKLDIADIRLENNVIIDVRAVVSEEYPQVCVPAEHFTKGAQPDIYVGIKINKDFTEAEITGFVKTGDIKRTKGNEHYFIVDAEDLTTVNDIEKAINSIPKKEKTFFALDHEKAAGLFIPFIDGTITEDDSNYLLEHISGCPECGKHLNNTVNLDFMLKNEKEKLLLETDYTLRLFAGDPVLAREEEITFIEETPEEKTSGTSTPRDWADELAANLIKEEDGELRDLSQEDLPEIEPVIEKQEIPEEEKAAEETVSAEEVPSDDVENILESLNDVEVIQGEEDIDNILSFFESEQYTGESQPESVSEIPKPVEPEIIKAEPEIKEEKYRGDVKIQKGDKMGYTSVIDSGGKEEEDLDFIIEDDAFAENLMPERDLREIFEAEIYDYKDRKTEPKKDLKTVFKSLLEDKSVIAFTVAVSLSTTVLFLYLGQINKQVQITNKSKTNNQHIKQPDIVNNTAANNNKTEIKREREPLKTYTRQIVKVIRPDIDIEIKGEKAEEPGNNIAETTVRKHKEIEVKNISWELPADIARDTKVKEYFLEIGQKLKTAIAGDLNTHKVDAQNSIINIYTELNPGGNVIKSKIALSSGIEKADNICLNTLNRTIKKYKFPAASSKRDKIRFILSIRT